MKKWMSLVLCVLFVVTLSACKKEQEETAAPTEQSQVVETTVGDQMAAKEGATADEAAQVVDEAAQAVEADQAAEATQEMPVEAK